MGELAVNNVIRPNAVVLPDSAQVPERNVVKPPPNRFTHEVVAEQPYYYMGVDQAAPPDGKFAIGAHVVLLRHDAGECWVADERGLYVATSCGGLRAL
jgi:hypothetical protein